jgi:hypothetical protein
MANLSRIWKPRPGGILNPSGVKLEEVLVYVERALSGDRKLSNQLFQTFLQLSNHPSAPPEERALGRVLGRILIGEREPDLSELHPEMAAEIKALLERLEQGQK